jgi:hypothetical protein
MIPEYCTQNNGDCPSCSLVNYGRDCANNRIAYTLGELAQVLKINQRAVRKMLNDAGGGPRLDEYTEDPGETVTRSQVVDLFADRAGSREARLLAGLLST